MNTLGAEIVIDNQMASLLSAIRFNDALLRCPERTSSRGSAEPGRCSWLSLGGERLERDETDDNLGFDEDSWRLAGGGQVDLSQDWSFGGALSYENSELTARDANARSDGGRFQAGIFARRRVGATDLYGSLGVGYGNFDIVRKPWPGSRIDATQETWLLSAQLRAARNFQSGRVNLRPRIDLGVDYLAMQGFNESGDSDLRIQLRDESDIYFSLQPAIDITTEVETGRGLLVQPRLTLGLTQFLGDAAPSVTGRFAAAPGALAPFDASTQLDKTHVDVVAGLDVHSRDNLTVRAEASGSFSSNSKSYGGGLMLQMSF